MEHERPKGTLAIQVDQRRSALLAFMLEVINWAKTGRQICIRPLTGEQDAIRRSSAATRWNDGKSRAHAAIGGATPDDGVIS